MAADLPRRWHQSPGDRTASDAASSFQSDEVNAALLLERIERVGNAAIESAVAAQSLPYV
jgi:hypothetical protein